MNGVLKKSLLIITVIVAGVAWGLSPRIGIDFDSLLGISVSPRPVQAGDQALKAGMVDPKTGKKVKYWVAPMDPTYIRNEPGKSPMGMDLVPVYDEEGAEKEPSSTIRIDPVTVQNMGVRLGTVTRRPLVKNIRTFGNVTYDETRIYAVNTKFNGWVEKLYVNFVGETVQKGQPLFEIYSPELVTAQEEFLLALQHYRSLEKSPYESVREGAERLLKASRTRLSYWDLSERQIAAVEKNGGVQKTVTVFSPVSGVVIQKKAYAGHNVKAGEHQYEIADLSKVWVDEEIYEYEPPWIRQGMTAQMELSYIPGRKFNGKVMYVYPFLTAKTRTARLRLEFPNPGFLLKPDMYANIYLESTIDPRALIIPQEAVIDSGVRKVVFVALGKGKFTPREIKLGVEGNHNDFQVLEGLKEGEQVVVSAQFMLDSESRLREAIQKMIEVRQKATASAAGEPAAADDLDLSKITMEKDDLDMSDLKMDEQGRPEAGDAVRRKAAAVRPGLPAEHGKGGLRDSR